MKHLDLLRSSAAWTFTAVILLTCPSFSYSAEETLPIEGIVYDSKNPAQSLASINGTLYQKGARYQDYEIVEIRQDRILAKNSVGKTAEYRIKGGTRPTTTQAVSETPAPPTRTLQPTPPSGETQNVAPTPPQDLWEQFRKIIGNLDPAVILNYAAEIAVMADLRNLYSQVNVIAMEEGGEKELTLDRLIKDDVINPAYKEGKNGYRFRVQAARQGVRVYADPINAEEKSRHFMIDDWGNMRAEQGSPATEKSPLVKPPAWLSGLIPKTPQRQIPPDDYPQEEQEENPKSKL